MPKVDPNDYAAMHGPGSLKRALDEAVQAEIEKLRKSYSSALDLKRKHNGVLRESIIHGICRRGEVVNIVAPPKIGKSWLGYNIALSVAVGASFLIEPWKCTEGNVVIIDNELHEETIAYRLPYVCKEMGIPEEYLERIRPIVLRGKNLDIHALAPVMTDIKEFAPSLVIFDAMYRFLPRGVKENDNADMTSIYNTLDHYAEIVGTAAFALIHHTSKGGQGDKDVMDVGAGGGSIGRATDNHIAIREHKEPGHFVVDSKPRSFTPSDSLSIVIKQAFPLWEYAPNLDPADLKGKKKQKEPKQEREHKDDDAVFVTLLSKSWQDKNAVQANATKAPHEMNGAEAKVFLSQIIGKFALMDLHEADGEKDCGLFIAKRKGVSLWFKLK